MATLNRFTAIGRLTRDVELRVTPKGTAIATFGLAINRKFKGEDGAQKEEVTFLDFEAWQKTAELCSKYLQKGSEVYIESRAKVDTWDDKTSGQKRSKVKFVIDAVQFLGGREQQGEGNQERQPEQRPAPKAAPAAQDDENIPF